MSLKLKKTIRKDKPGKFQYTFTGTLKRKTNIIYKKGTIVKLYITKEQFNEIKKCGYDAVVLMSRVEGHGHNSYWSIKDFDNWYIEERSMVTIYKQYEVK